MPLVVEDGTGLPNADGYLSVADANAYHSAMGNTAWAPLAEADKEAALRRATQYLDTRYQWKGERLTGVQALEWPRTSVAWPVKAVKTACAELALRAAEQGSLYTNQVDAQVTRETVGPITVEYAAGQNGGQVRYAFVDDLLAGLLAGGSRMTLRLERAS